MSDPNDLQKSHNDGQTDCKNGEYHQPVPIGISEIILYDDETIEHWEEMNKAYDQGWNNARKNI